MRGVDVSILAIKPTKTFLALKEPLFGAQGSSPNGSGGFAVGTK